MEERTSASSRTPFSKLSADELVSRCKNLAKERTRLQQKVKQSFAAKAVAVGEGTNTFLRNTLLKNEHDLGQFGENSIQRILWEQQLENSKHASAKQYRWHPMMIRWCLKLHNTSKSAYRLMRESGFLTLPSEQCLRQYVDSVGNHKCISLETLKILDTDLGDHRDIVLLLDEMKIKDQLVLDKSSGSIIGYMEMGEINAEIRHLEDNKKNVATHTLVMMAQSCMKKVTVPVATFASCGGASASELYFVVWEVVGKLELFDIHVRGIVCDGASANRMMFKLSAGDEEYKGVNGYGEGRELYFIADVPHLMKTTRNCWEKSSTLPGSTRHMVVSWS